MDRLDQVIRGAEREPQRLVVHGAHDDHGDPGGDGVGLEVVQDLPAILVRHADVQQDEVGPGLPREPEPLVAVQGGQEFHAGLLEGLHDERVDLRIVVDDQDPALPLEHGRPGRRLGGHGHRRERDGFGLVARGDQGERHGERGALAQPARDRDAPPHGFDQPLGDRQAEPGALVLAREGGVGLVELGEEVGQVLGGHADPGVSHLDPHAVLVQEPGGEAHAALVGELDRVGEEVVQDLHEPDFVGLQGGDVRVDLRLQENLLLQRLELEVAGRGADEDLEIDGPELQRHAIGLDLGEVEDVVDQLEEVLGIPHDAPQGVLLLVRDLAEGAGEHEVAEADDRVERGAKLVGHLGEEVGLGLVHPNQVIVGAPQLLGLQREVPGPVGDLLLEGREAFPDLVGHDLEAGRQPGDLVLAFDLDGRVEAAGPDLLRRGGEHAEAPGQARGQEERPDRRQDDQRPGHDEVIPEGPEDAGLGGLVQRQQGQHAEAGPRDRGVGEDIARPGQNAAAVAGPTLPKVLQHPLALLGVLEEEVGEGHAPAPACRLPPELERDEELALVVGEHRAVEAPRQ